MSGVKSSWWSLINAVAALLLLAATWVAFTVPPAQGFQEPDAARIIFWHVPFAIFSNLALLGAAIFGVRFLQSKRPKDGSTLSSFWDLGALFAIVGLATGVPFSRVQWGAWWHWDPRQTSFLLVTLMLLGGLVLRAGFSGAMKQRTVLAGYAVVCTVPGIFLTFVYPRLPSVKAQSLHPSTTIAQGGLDENYRLGLYLMSGFLLLFSVMVLSLRTRLDVLNDRLENLDGNLEDHRNAATSFGVVRSLVDHETAGREDAPR